MDKLTIFLSHSHKDIEKVRKIRDLFELLGCEPLIFYLKCLDNDDDHLQDFIKKKLKHEIFFYTVKVEILKRANGFKRS